MLKIKLINSEASLNDYFHIESIEFVPGEDVTVAFQLFDAQRNIRYVPPSAAELTVTLINTTGDEFNKTAAIIDAADRSMWKFSLTQVESETLAGQNIEFSLDVNGDATKILKAVIDNVLIRKNLSGDC